MADYIKNALDAAKAPPTQPGNKWPPIINLSDAEGYRFKSGSAELSPDFRQSLRENVPGRVLALMKEFDVDLIEVVGHTDEQPNGVRQSNLDRDLVSALKNNGEVSRLVPADNAGLGLARAVAVAGVLMKDQGLTSYKIIPLSGAQLIKNDESLTTDGNAAEDKERRRIEIRLRKSSPRDVTLKKDNTAPPNPTRAPPLSGLYRKPAIFCI